VSRKRRQIQILRLPGALPGAVPEAEREAGLAAVAALEEEAGSAVAAVLGADLEVAHAERPPLGLRRGITTIRT